MHGRGYVRGLSLSTHAHWMHAAIGLAVHAGLQDIKCMRDPHAVKRICLTGRHLWRKTNSARGRWRGCQRSSFAAAGGGVRSPPYMLPRLFPFRFLFIFIQAQYYI
jgi:hypothetical protein